MGRDRDLARGRVMRASPRRPCLLLSAALLSVATAAAGARAVPSTCYGSPGAGRLAHGVPLPAAGANFSAYTDVGPARGRVYLHDRVRDIVVDAYAALQHVLPAVHFVYGEGSLPEGGPTPPHRSHQAGVSIDLFVPMRGADGAPRQLPRTADNWYGYGVELDDTGRAGDLEIDFAALAEHLYQLDQAGRRHRARIVRVIFDPALTRRLLAAEGGERVRHLPFMRRPAWIRHDEHVHVDFDVGCAP